MQDDGIPPDAVANDGTYTGQYQFAVEKNADGLWKFFVIAQDINNAQPTMSPEQQAEIVGRTSTHTSAYYYHRRRHLSFGA
jgi:hypothetical protein